MRKTYFIQLEDNDLGQIIDGLREREESWQRTAEYFRSGENAIAMFAIEECTDEYEAEQIAQFYARIIHDLERQRREQSA